MYEIGDPTPRLHFEGNNLVDGDINLVAILQLIHWDAYFLEHMGMSRANFIRVSRDR